MPTEQATLHLPSFISTLCKTNHIECLKEYDFKVVFNWFIESLGLNS